MTTALGIDVASDLLDRWRNWFAPQLQPFSTSRLGQLLLGSVDRDSPRSTSATPSTCTAMRAARDWTRREPFEEWLATQTRPVRGTQRDHLPGVVLVWRNHDGLVEHAAVTLGEGYTFNKPSQGWFSPHLVWTVKETSAASRYEGAVLSRYLITP